jgi:predicted acyltransferase
LPSDAGTGLAQASAPIQTPRAAPAARVASLDAFRGFTMFWISAGGALVNAIQRMQTPLLSYQLSHTHWEGLRYYDCIWPSFMLMAGVSVALSYRRRIQDQTWNQMQWQAWKRAIILFLLGSLRESISLNHPYLVELSSALQPIAVACLVAFYVAGWKTKYQAALAGGILATYAFVLAVVPAPGVPAGSYEITRNLVRWTDLAILGRTHPEGWGTVICTLPTISTTLIGLMLGNLLLSNRSAITKLNVIVLAGAGCLACGLAISPVVPVIMKIWTTSYGLMTAGWACLLFALFYWIIDVRGYRRWSFFFSVIGLNAIAAYMGNSIIPVGHIVGIFTSEAHSPLLHGLAVLVVEWLVLYWMYRRKIFLKA